MRTNSSKTTPTAVSMAAFNPLQVFIFPFLFFVALPLALCAGVTTILAFMVLFLRLFLVYFDVSLETIRYLLVGDAAHNRYVASRRTPSASSPVLSESSRPSSPETRQIRRRRRQGSVSISSGTITPVASRDGLAIAPSIGLERDFEGIGGWRIDNADADADAADEHQWYNLNSRLEIPDRRHHFRSQSGGAVLSGTNGLGLYMTGANTPAANSTEGVRTYTSPNSSRSRTPTSSRPRGFTKLGEEACFLACYEAKHVDNTR
ncbi:hypothetical protein F5Y06DRAFT_257176 [Hypoxylon sp. FL0890]|nr:hypothetical protein F5Y06DRAFT_257176 [Hypoxylon sp. FL0890]